MIVVILLSFITVVVDEAPNVEVNVSEVTVAGEILSVVLDEDVEDP